MSSREVGTSYVVLYVQRTTTRHNPRRCHVGITAGASEKMPRGLFSVACQRNL